MEALPLPTDAATLPVAQTPASAPLVAPVVPGSAASDGLGGSGQKATPLPLAASLPPAAWLAAAAPMASLPALDAPVVTLHDRRVRLGPPGAPQEAQPSLYRLCRQWVQNEPDLGDPPGPEPPSASKLPPLPPVSEEAAEVLRQAAPQQQPLPAPAPAAAPAAGAASAAAEAAGDAATASSSEPPAVDVLLKHHKQHWAAVRQHRRTRAAAAQQRYAQRLQAYMQAGGAVGGAAALPIPMQQG